MLVKLLDSNRPQEIQPVTFSDMPHGCKNFMSLDRIVEGINRIDNQLYIETSLIEGMESTRVKIEEKLKGLEGVKYKVAYMKVIEGKTYREIAVDLNLSEDRIRHIGADIKRA